MVSLLEEIDLLVQIKPSKIRDHQEIMVGALESKDDFVRKKALLILLNHLSEDNFEPVYCRIRELIKVGSSS